MPTAERWCLRRRALPQAIEKLTALGLDPLLAGVLYARKLDTPEQVNAFLSSEGDLGDPTLLPDMSVAVDRLHRAIHDAEQIVVYGDFDADGVCATALLVSALRDLGAQVSPYIPDRFDEGYGLNEDAVERLHRQGARVLVTVDCGVRSVREAERAASLGLDVIITDHHSLADALPPALAVINPKREGCAYPFRELSGVGVAYRLAQALNATHPRANDLKIGAPTPSSAIDLESVLDLVALGTVADIVPLCGENRILVQRGLQRLREAPRPGLQALMAGAGVAAARASSQDIAFRLAPRINAAGRLANAGLAYNLLMAEDGSRAQPLAAELEALNRERQQLLETQVNEARQILGEPGEQRLLFVAGEGFHEGIVGLVASRLTDGYQRPSLVMRRDGQVARGSARSIEGFHITRALDHCADLLVRYGGHARAAGFTLDVGKLDEFRTRLQTYGMEHLPETPTRQHMVDAIVTLDDLSFQAVKALALLEPTGEDNPEPALSTLHLRISDLRPVGADGKHLRMGLANGRVHYPAIAFFQGYRAQEFRAGDLIDVIYRPALNEWQGQVSLQLEVRAMRKSADVAH